MDQADPPLPPKLPDPGKPAPRRAPRTPAPVRGRAKPEAMRAERGKPEPAKPEPGKPERARPERAKLERAKPERARGGEARQIADFVPQVGENAFRRFGFIQSALVTRWTEIVGVQMARICSPESLRFARGTKLDGTLRLTVTSAAAPLIQHAIPDIIVRANRFFGYAAVGQVQLLHGAVRHTMPVRRAVPLAPVAPPPLSAAADASLRSIADPELRAVLEGLAGALARRVPVLRDDAVPVLRDDTLRVLRDGALPVLRDDAPGIS